MCIYIYWSNNIGDIISLSRQTSRSFFPGSVSFPLGKSGVPYDNLILSLGLSFPICNMKMWDEMVLSVSGSSKEMLCGTAVSDQEMPSVFSCPPHPGLSSGVPMMSLRQLLVLFVFLVKQSHAESEACVAFSAGSLLVNFGA